MNKKEETKLRIAYEKGYNDAVVKYNKVISDLVSKQPGQFVRWAIGMSSVAIGVMTGIILTVLIVRAGLI